VLWPSSINHPVAAFGHLRIATLDGLAHTDLAMLGDAFGHMVWVSSGEVGHGHKKDHPKAHTHEKDLDSAYHAPVSIAMIQAPRNTKSPRPQAKKHIASAVMMFAIKTECPHRLE
jgi:hypothetical protein